MRTLVLVAALVGLSACATPAEVSAPTMSPPPGAGVSNETPAEATPAADSCKAGDFKYLIGKNKSEIPPPIDPSKRRVTCTSCPMTMDYRPDRLNILHDAETGIVKEVKCG